MNSDGNEVKIAHSDDILPQLSEKQNHNDTEVSMATTDGNNKGGLANAYGDWGSTINVVRNNNMAYSFRGYTYLPEPSRLWNVGYYQPNYIRNINNDGSGLFFNRF